MCIVSSLQNWNCTRPNRVLPTMADLYHVEEGSQLVCWDRKYYSTYDDQLKVLATSKTVYVGNLSFFTTEQQIHEVFSIAGPINRIIMGLNQKTKTPCGFCFVEYYRREHAAACLKFISGGQTCWVQLLLNQKAIFIIANLAYLIRRNYLWWSYYSLRYGRWIQRWQAVW